ncbi:MAG: methyltransferase domain-containing protein [Chloroflexi bacterium]|nr:methyltransferase domain-containing protein [Chloroflexota bacterium]
MQYLSWFIGAGIILAWQLLVWLGEIRTKREQYRKALFCARRMGKPLLIAGGPYGNQWLRRFLKIPAHGGGDVCLDINRNAVAGHPQPVVASITNIPFGDKVFGAVFVSHVLEHIPTVTQARQALDEFTRTSDAVFIVSPSRQSVSGWLHPDHHLWVWQEGDRTFIEKRRKLGKKEKEEHSLNNV